MAVWDHKNQGMAKECQENKKKNHIQQEKTDRWYCHQGRNQGRRQPAPGHPLGSLKNKGHTVKNKFSFDPNILFI
jgi:hypothetical protein